MKIVEMKVDDEFVAAGDAIGGLIGDISAKKSWTEVTANALPRLMSAVSGYAAFATDIKKVDNQMYLLRQILLAVEPAPEATPAA